MFHFAQPTNEPVLTYLKNSPERVQLEKDLKKIKSTKWNIPLIINGKEIKTAKNKPIHQPHDLEKPLGKAAVATTKDIYEAIDSALHARRKWADTPFLERATIFLKAAELIATKYRGQIVGATMLGQSKNIYQAEIDSACELIDFLRFNVYFLSQIYENQPISPQKNIHNRIDYRPLEGFIYAITPFNFTAIGGNLCCAPALCGNVVIWKPAHTQIVSAYLILKVLEEAGLPPGVINLITGDSKEITDSCLSHKDFAGLHFTGSTEVFNSLWKTIGNNLDKYKNYPRIVGETGGKDFVVVHSSAQVEQVVTALIAGAFEYQGQKCSAASRAYLPSNLASPIITSLKSKIATLKTGTVENVNNFVNAVIDKNAYNRIVEYIEYTKKSKEAKIIAGGKYSDQKGYFIEPTLIETTNPHYKTMEEEIFGPVLTIYTYPENEFENILKTVDKTSEYALTGAIFAQDKFAIQLAEKVLVNSAGNLYLNDKPSGAVVAQQPFGGARKSGTNDKSGSYLNLLRWLSPRTIKENFTPPTTFQYPYMNNKK